MTLGSPLSGSTGPRETLSQDKQEIHSCQLLIGQKTGGMQIGPRPCPEIQTIVGDLTHCKDQFELFSTMLPPTSQSKDIWWPLKSYLLARGTGTEQAGEEDGAGDRGQLL